MTIHTWGLNPWYMKYIIHKNSTHGECLVPAAEYLYSTRICFSAWGLAPSQSLSRLSLLFLFGAHRLNCARCNTSAMSCYLASCYRHRKIYRSNVFCRRENCVRHLSCCCSYCSSVTARCDFLLRARNGQSSSVRRRRSFRREPFRRCALRSFCCCRLDRVYWWNCCRRDCAAGRNRIRCCADRSIFRRRRQRRTAIRSGECLASAFVHFFLIVPYEA